MVLCIKRNCNARYNHYQILSWTICIFLFI